MAVMSATCVSCDATESAEIDSYDMWRWANGTLVQEAFPYLNKAQRELFFQSKICGSCWNLIEDLCDD